MKNFKIPRDIQLVETSVRIYQNERLLSCLGPRQGSLRRERLFKSNNLRLTKRAQIIILHIINKLIDPIQSFKKKE